MTNKQSKNKQLSLNKTIIYNILSVVIVNGVSFFTSPIFSRLLGTNNYGVYSVFNTWHGILTIILPLSVAATISIAATEYKQEELRSYYSSTLSVGIISTIILSIIILIMGLYFPNLLGMNQSLRICVLLQALFNFITNFAASRYAFELRANDNLILAISNLIFTIPLSFFWVISLPKETNYLGKIYGSLVGSAIVVIVFGGIIYKEGRVFIKREYVEFCLPLSIPVIFHSLSNMILNQSDRIMLQKMSSNSQVGIYSLAYNFTSVLVIIYSAFNNSWSPFYFKYLNNNDKDSLYTHAENYCNLYTFILLGFLFVFKEVYSVFADKSYWYGTKIIPILLVGFYFIFLHGFAINYEYYIKKTRRMAIITVSAAVLNILLNYIFIKQFDTMGAAIATLISYVYLFLIHLLYVRKVSNGEYPFGVWFYIKSIAIIVAGLLIYYICIELYIIRWTFAIIIGLYIVFSMYKRKAIF